MTDRTAPEQTRTFCSNIVTRPAFTYTSFSKGSLGEIPGQAVIIVELR